MTPEDKLELAWRQVKDMDSPELPAFYRAVIRTAASNILETAAALGMPWAVN